MFLDEGHVSQGSLTSGQSGPLIQAAVSTASPTYVSGQTMPLSLNTSGQLRVEATFSGTISVGTVDQGNPAVVANAWPIKITDGVDTASVSAGGALLVDGTGGSFPISGTVTANQGGTWNINNISGTVSLPTGAATEASLAKLTLSQGSSTSGQSGTLVQGAVTTAAPSYTTAQTSPLSLTTSGALRVDASGSTQPISGTVTVSNLANTIMADDSVSASSYNPNYSFLMGYGSGGGSQWARLRIAPDNADAIPSSSTGHLQVLAHPVGFNGTTWDRQRSAGTNSDGLATTTVGALYVNSFGMLFNGTSWDRFRGDTTNGLDVDVTRVSGTVTVSGTVAATQSGTWNINNISGTVSLPTGAATETTLAKLPLAQASTTSGQSGILVQGAVTTAAPTYSTGQTSPLSLTTSGALRVDASASTQPISGTVTANQGGAPWSMNQTQWNGVTVSTGNGVAGTGVVRVAIASDNTAFSVNAVQSGTWTVQPGNTANTTPWLVTGSGTAGTPASGVLTVQGFNPTNADSTALEASRVIKASAGKLYTLTIFNSSTSGQYILIFNSTTVPANGTAPTVTPIYVPPNSNASLDYGINGRSFSTGIAVSNSSTAATKTLGSADCWFSATYI